MIDPTVYNYYFKFV